MGKHQGDEAAEPAASRVDRRRALQLAAGFTVTLVGWGLLVWLAIDFGGQARTGSTVAWVFLVVATIGATACLFLALTLIGRMRALFRGELPRSAPRGVAGKRAAR